ncbi:2-methylisocitrate lyase-like PEP mutase family enzyme [Herbihabitans rhizosphaerae]|uniref:2-methylisocitrate lyase-like PEP mutase family enzyme n=1 Tax=Herbihabitans rhizosphaerae TaxID=1872711 RepID=A0A4Q7KCZ2_9PSEU|nr:isocitrate lyase/phosphoenolpyruvate mutase family protein [Herbihabitans rhizosphaerae]RZS30525.1 2-methylisocitrate lyase-like PEP mutase family enzyme [Herbihabitans rhizosphaerae]
MRITERDDVLAILSDPRFMPPPPERAGPVGTMTWLRATVARFSAGETHERRRAIAESTVDGLDPAELRYRAAAWTDPAVEPRYVPVAVLAGALGITDVPRAVAAVREVSVAYQGVYDVAPDEAVATLVSMLPGEPEVTANRIGLLVQACDATAALIEGADPPVRITRRTALVDARGVSQGETVELDIGTLPFGAELRACPGRDLALALAEGVRKPFHSLHSGPAPLLLPNAWDFASAAMLVDAGFPAIGTTSLGVAAAAGLPDGTGVARAETVELARRLVRLPRPITVDIEGGFSDDPAEVAALVEELAEMGVAGVNIEDGRADGSLVPQEHQRRVIKAVKHAAPDLFVNARTDTHWLGAAGIDETLRRVRAFADAGADGVFVPLLNDPQEITAVVRAVDVPLNTLLCAAAPTVDQLGELGVRRVSTGSRLFRAALGAMLAAARTPDQDPADIPSYAEVVRQGDMFRAART